MNVRPFRVRSSPSSNRARHAGVVLACGLAFVACRRADLAPSNGAAAPGSAATTPEPPPLDTNWRRNPGHLLAAGDRAPDFEGIAHTGMRVKLSAFSGKPTVVYFAPRDASPEAASEARGYREDWMKFNEKIGTVLGVSADDRATHYDFATAEKLPFLLVADEQAHIARSFGCVSEQGSIMNVAFLIGADGKIVRVFSDPSPDGHARAVIAALEAM